jgi:hypothetical protein
VQDISFAQREEFREEHRGTFVPRADGFCVLVEPIFCLPQERERKQTEPDCICRDTPYDYGLTEFKEVLQMSIGVLVGLP